MPLVRPRARQFQRNDVGTSAVCVERVGAAIPLPGGVTGARDVDVAACIYSNAVAAIVTGRPVEGMPDVSPRARQFEHGDVVISAVRVEWATPGSVTIARDVDSATRIYGNTCAYVSTGSAVEGVPLVRPRACQFQHNDVCTSTVRVDGGCGTWPLPGGLTIARDVDVATRIYSNAIPPVSIPTGCPVEGMPDASPRVVQFDHDDIVIISAMRVERATPTGVTIARDVDVVACIYGNAATLVFIGRPVERVPLVGAAAIQLGLTQLNKL